ncbi:nuclear transport factor 2 family protein [Flavobacteriaceae bacterium TP-CH-4]|uniref:Nuclear transport factor 2 family protein n=1 Tax=Pelagihabitans pacificus TaxID=2696054 RepID=A0A967E5F1_9FLAO|nr:nuclear transport factor 2 family protein [Pelagihabitans pacificus]NHF58515.1 nuclear transport factor 2 family protein [Pelagihabitans pacificus]
MTKINIQADCGNSPRKEFLKELNIAFAKGNANFIVEHASDDMVWTIYGDKKIEGKEVFREEIHIMKQYTADEMTLNSIITHGREAAANGEMRMGDHTYVFCDVYSFTNTTSMVLKEMQSYVVKL